MISETPLELRSDDELMLLTRGAMQAAFHVLVRRHQARVLRIALRYLRDPTLAKDIAQNTFLEIYRNRERYRPSGKFVPYLCRIAINQCRMSIRASRPKQAALADVCVADLSAETVLARESRRDVEDAVAQLSEKLRAVVVLRFGGELKLDEISDSLDLPLGTVKRRLFDAMTKLRELLEGAV